MQQGGKGGKGSTAGVKPVQGKERRQEKGKGKGSAVLGKGKTVQIKYKVTSAVRGCSIITCSRMAYSACYIQNSQRPTLQLISRGPQLLRVGRVAGLGVGGPH